MALIWADDNIKPLQGNWFQLFRSLLIGIPPDYNDDTNRRNTHPLLLSKAEAKGVISKQDLEVLKRALVSDNDQEDKRDVNRNPATGAYMRQICQRLQYCNNNYTQHNHLA